jgi:hypothetical protein
MNDTQLTASVIALTALLRSRSPRIQGLWVPLVALAFGALLSVLASPGSFREALVHGLVVALSAVGGMSAISYAGTKVGAALSGNLPFPLVPAPPSSSDTTPPRKA